MRLALTPFEINKFSIIVERIKRIENELNFSIQQWDPQAIKRKGFDQKLEFPSKKFKPDIRKKSIQLDKLICDKYEKKHFRQCLVGSEKSYICGQS